ncbi:MAG: accessory factor UbiK family protein [Limnobacter sp.]|nr:accessory factor UbiK family protein [Limnobacter sp.]
MSINPFEKVQNNVNSFLQAKGLQNLENPLTNLIRQGLQDMEFVSLEDFETQREVLERLRLRVKELENRLAELESKGH